MEITFSKYRALARQSRQAIETLRGSAQGEEVFIVGSGPSISDTDLSKLKDSRVLLLNNAISLLDHFQPSNAHIMLSDHLRAIELRAQIVERNLDCIATTDKIMNSDVDPEIFREPFSFIMPRFTSTPNGDIRVSPVMGFSDDPQKGLFLGKSVVFPAIQFAYFMGARAITLVGIDMTLGPNIAYFDDKIVSNWTAFDYPRDGRPHFLHMASVLRAKSVLLTNATAGGALDALAHFPRRFAKAGHAPATAL